MSSRKVTVVGALLLVVSVGCVIGLQYAVATKLDRWDAWPFAVLAHGAMLPAIAAAGLSWRSGHGSVRVIARVLAAVTVGVWLYTWFVPLQKLVAWIVIHWTLWMGA
jgi:hypothetical protein